MKLLSLLLGLCLCVGIFSFSNTISDRIPNGDSGISKVTITVDGESSDYFLPCPNNYTAAGITATVRQIGQILGNGMTATTEPCPPSGIPSNPLPVDQQVEELKPRLLEFVKTEF